MQEEDGHHGPPEGRHAEGEEAPEEGERGLRRFEEEHVDEPKPEAAQGGDPQERHPVHRKAAGLGVLPQPAGHRDGAAGTALPDQRGPTQSE